MITRRRALAWLAAPLAADTRTSVGFISEPSGPHLGVYLEALRAENIGEIGIADPSGGIFERARSILAAKKLLTFTDQAEMLRTVRPQLALVAREAHAAPESIRMALDRGCHVLAEKPACVRAEQFAELVKLAQQRNRHLMLAFSTRLHPGVKRARELAAGGSIGKPYGLTLHFIADQTRLARPEYQRSWFASRAKAGGGHLIWLGIHYLDLAQFLTGQRITQVTAQTANAGGQPMDVEDSVAVTFQLEGGAVGTLQGGYYLDKGYHNGVTLWGPQGWLRFDPNSDRLEWYSRVGGARTEMPGKGEGYPLLVRTAASIAAGAAPPFVTADECLHVLRVVFAAYESARGGRAVKPG